MSRRSLGVQLLFLDIIQWIVIEFHSWKDSMECIPAVACWARTTIDLSKSIRKDSCLVVNLWTCKAD